VVIDEGTTEMAKTSTTTAHEKGSGNVFADLGLPHPEQELLKARLTLQIYQSLPETPSAREGTPEGVIRGRRHADPRTSPYQKLHRHGTELPMA
jgi:hypothetical protein